VTIVLGILTGTVLLTWIFRNFLLTWTLKHDPVLSSDTFQDLVDPPPSVAVIIPARNEEHNIGECLESLLAQDYARGRDESALRIIVVDDRSDDRTAEIVETFVRRDPRVQLIRNTECPEGWTGKNYALQLGAQAAGEPDFLLFVDADTRHHLANISQAVTYAVRNNVDMLSLLIPIVNVSFWEKVVQPMTGSMLCIRYPLWKVNDPASPIAFGNGQYILIRRQTYQSVDGHHAVREQLLEDIALARRVKHSGGKLCVAYTSDISRIRMYRSLGEICRGWARIFLAGMNRSLRMMLVGVAMLLFFSLLPYFVLIGTALTLALAGPTGPLWALLALAGATVIVEMLVMARFFRTFQTDPRYVVFHLLGCLVALGILLSAIGIRFSRKGLVWKGTHYDPSRHAGPVS